MINDYFGLLLANSPCLALKDTVLDNRAQRGADANNDHYFVKTRIRLRLSTYKNKNKLKSRYDVELLKNKDIKAKCNDCVKKKLEEHKEETQYVYKRWKQQNITYVESAKEVLGLRKENTKHWISENTWKLIDERKGRSKRERQNHQEKCERRQNEVDSRERRESAECSKKGRHKELYNIIKQLTKRGNRQTAAMKSKDGELLKNKEARLARRKKHFEEEQRHPKVTTMI